MAVLWCRSIKNGASDFCSLFNRPASGRCVLATRLADDSRNWRRAAAAPVKQRPCNEFMRIWNAYLSDPAPRRMPAAGR